MRARAEEISTASPEERLPVPATRDEVARLGETLNEMLTRLGDALERERAFVADASHELRTPLAILRAELDLALAEGRSPEELRAALASAGEETDRLSQLTDDLLTIAQTERGELPLRRERLRLGDTFETVERRFARRADEAGRRIEVAGGGEIELRADRIAPRPGDRHPGRQRAALRRRDDRGLGPPRRRHGRDPRHRRGRGLPARLPRPRLRALPARARGQGRGQRPRPRDRRHGRRGTWRQCPRRQPPRRRGRCLGLHPALIWR